MSWFYMILIAMLSSFMFYSLDLIGKMAHDLKYIKSRMDAIKPL